jgi:ribosomal protein L22
MDKNKMLAEAIQYLKEVAEHEKSKRFRKFVESAIIILQHVAQNEEDIGLFIDVFLDIADEYLRTKNQYVLIEALRFFAFDE